MSRPAAFVVGAAALNVGWKLVGIWSGWFDANVVADDAYYYFTIAKNLAAGLGPTFDGLAPTNGFHPAWQLLLVPLWRIWPHDLWTPIHAALTLSTFLDLLSGVVLYHIARRRIDRWTATLAAVLWLLWPLPAIVGVRGMEASLNALALLLLFGFVDGLSYRPVRGWDAVFAGALLGLCGLVRTDQLILGGLALLLCVFGGGIRGIDSWRRGLTWLATAAISSAAVVSPWFTWSMTNFGSPLQVSALMKARGHKMVGALPDDWESVGGFIDASSHALFAPVLIPLRHFVGEEFEELQWFPVLAVVIFVATTVLAVAFALRWREARAAERSGWIFPVGYVLLHVALYGLFLRSYSPWYAQPLYAMVSLILGRVVAMLARGNTRSRRILLGSGLALIAAHGVAFFLFVQRVDHTPRGPEQRVELLFERAIERLPDRRVALGAFDAGVLGYLATEIEAVTVVNLDCLVNNVAYRSLVEGRYPEYVRSNVDLVVQRFERFQTLLDRSDYLRLKSMLRVEE